MSESNSYTENPFLTSAAGEEISLADERKIHDFSTMSPEYFASTYGMDEYLSMHRQMAETENAVRAAAVQGNAIDNILDTGKNFAAGALSGLSSTASLVTTPIRPVSEGFARLTDMINKASESLSSESERASRELYQFKQQGLKNRLDREEREGKISNLERIAEEVAGSVGNAFSSGHYFELGTSALGSMAAGGPVAKGISLGLGAAAKLAPGIAKGINTAAQASTTVQKLKDAAPWMLSMGLQEGGGTYGDMLLKGINVPYEELMANSPEFQTLYAQYRKEKLTDAEAKEKAREDLAYMAAREAGLLTAGAATVANYLTAGLGKGIDKVSFAGTTVSPFLRHSGDSVKKAIGNALSEPVEEGITEGLGQVASNYATREYLNRNQDLYEDVGSSIAEGAVGGLGITGVNTATSTLGSLYEEGAKLNAERKAKQATVPVSTPKAINLPAPSQSMMNLSEDPEDTRSVSQVAVDSQEELKQNQQAVNSIQNPATSIKDEETGFDSSNTALEPELQQKHNVASKPEFLNTFAKQKNENDAAEGTISLEEANKVALSTAMDLDNIAVTLQKIAKKEITVTPEEYKALVSQANASAAALKNYFSVTDVSEIPSELEFLKTKFDVTNKPETVTEERLDRVLKSSTTLSDVEKDVITSLKGFFAQEKAIDAERKNLNELSDKTELVAKNVTWGKEQGYRNSGKFSLWQWASDVYKAKAAGNEASLKNSINEVRKLVTHFENKIKALNASAALAKSSNGDAQKVTFDMLNPKSRRFEKNQGVVHWKPTSTKSTQLARSVQFDLVRTIQAYNHLIKLAPNLGFKPITQFTRLADGKGDDINLPAISSYEEIQTKVNKEPEITSEVKEVKDTLDWLPEDTKKDSSENTNIVQESKGNTSITNSPSSNPYEGKELKGFSMTSGGAKGADSYWGKVAQKLGIPVKHFYAKQKTPKGNLEVSPEDFKEGLVKVQAAAKRLGRTWSKSPYVQNLLIRNWSQVKYADSIFAVSTFEGGKVTGGTAYAVDMAIHEGKPVYVYDQNVKAWFTYKNNSWVKTNTPVLTRNFAGIGTRELNSNGRKAIIAVFKKTIDKEGNNLSQEANENIVASQKEVAEASTPISTETTSTKEASREVYDDIPELNTDTATEVSVESSTSEPDESVNVEKVVEEPKEDTPKDKEEATLDQFSVSENGFDVSNKEDKLAKKFSPSLAKLSDGRSIEEHYQVDIKGYTSIEEGKRNPSKNLTGEELKKAYLDLWREWADAHPELMGKLRDAALKNNNSLVSSFLLQADALTTLLNEGYGLEEFKNIQAQRKKQEAIKEMAKKIKDNFKSSILSRLFKLKGAFNSRLSLLTSQNKFTLSDIISNQKLLDRFLSYDKDPERVKALITLDQNETSYWTDLLNHVDSVIIPGIEKRAKDQLIYKEAYQKAYPDTDTDSLSGFYHLKLFKDGKYPEELTRAVGLATLSTILQSQHFKDNEELADMFGVSEEDIDEFTPAQLNVAQRSMNKNMLLTDIVKKAKNYMNVSSIPELPLGSTDGVIAAIAHGALESLLKNQNSSFKLIKRKFTFYKKYANGTVVIKNGKPAVDKTVEVLVPMYKNGTERGKATYKLSLPVELTSNSYFLDNLLLTSSSGHHREFWGNAEMPIHPTLNHTNVPIKEGQAKAIENRQKVDFNINEEIYKAFTNMGEKGIIHFFSEDPEGKEHLYHNEHLESVKGKNDALLRSYAIMQHEYKVAQQISKNTGIPLDKVNRHYAYNVSRVGRYQMEGSATPQGDKLIREFMSPTKDVIDLNDDHTKGNYLRCIAQGFGVKVNNFHYEKTEDIEKALNKYTSHPDFKVIQDYFDNPSPTLDDVKNLKKAFTSTGIDKTHVGFACARDYCKYLKLEKDKEKQEAKEALAKYTTYVYLEADGVTNGTANFLMLANGNQLTPATLNASRRVGVNYGSDAGESLGQIKDTQPDAKIDTYTWVAKRSADTLNKDIFNRKLVKTPEGEVWEEYGEPIGNLRDAYKTVYSFFGDWGKKADEDFFVRNVVKNPVTTVNYGAGAASLAYKLFLDLKKKFNAKISDANIKFIEREDKDITWGMLFTGAETKEEAKAKYKELNKAILVIETAAQQAAIDNNRPTLQISNEYLIPPVNSNWSEDKIIEFTKKIEFLNGKEHTFYNLADQINFFTEKNIGKTSIYSDITENDPKNILTFFNNLNTISYKLQDFIFQRLKEKVINSLTKEQKKLGLSQKQFNDILNTVGVAAYNLDSGDRIISPSKQKRISDSGYIYESVSLTEVKKNKDGKELFNLTGQIEPDILGHITYAPDVMKPSEPGVALMPDSIIGFGDASMMTILSSIMHTLDVFDGFNSRVSDIDENGLKSNQAVYESWQTNLGTINKQAWAKVMRSTFLNEEFANEFWEYLANNPVDAFTKDFFETIAKSLRNKKIEEVRFKNGVFTLSAEKYKETFDKNRLVSLFTEEAFNLLDAKEEVLARSIFARNAINSSQDQMASSEHPYFHKGTVNSETLIDDKAIGSAYNNAYTTAEIELSKVDLTPEANPLAVEIPSSALPDLATPVQEIKETATENKEKDIVEAKETSSDPEDQKPTPNTEQPKVKAKLVKKLSINRDNLRLKVRDLSEILKKGLSKKQQAIYRAIKGINATAFLKEYSIYSGSREELNVLLAQDKSPLFLEEGDKGLFNPETKTLYIVGKDPTTIMHEMIHAFVADKIYTVCEALGEDFNIKPVEGIDRNIVSSVIGLKRLVDEFVQDSFDLETNPKLVEVQGIIKYHLNEGNIATAINEMVAYSLSDEVIADYLNNTYADYLVLLPDNANRIPTNPDYVETLPEKFFKYLKRTLGYVKRILFHGGKGPFNKSDDNGNFTILSELTLYTRIIHTTTINTQLSNSLKALSLDMATRIPAFKEISDIVTEAIKKKTPEGIRADRLKTRVISKLIANLQKKIPSMDQQELNACSLVLEAFLGVNKINPEVFSRIADMYHYARSKLTVEDFMKDPSNLSERAIAEEKYNALFNNGLTSSNSLLVPSFFAIALTSSEVKNILSKIKVERKKESESEFYLDRKIDEAGSYIFNKLSDILNKSNSDNVDDLLSALADSLIKTSLDEGYKPSFAKKELDKLNSKFGNFVQDKAEKVINWGINNKGTNKFVKTIKTFIAAIAVPFATEDTVNRAFNEAERVLAGTINKRNAIGHLITDIFGRTEDNGEIYDLIKPIKAEVQQVRSRAKGEVPRTLKEVFSRKLEEDALKQLYFGLGRIDVSCLGLYPIVKKYFSSPSLVAKKIKDLETKINDPKMIKEAKHLGTFLATGVVTSTSLLRNAEAIVANLNDPQRKGSLLDVKLDKQQVDNVDKLASLYAIQKMDGKTKGTINKLLTAEPEGMNVLIGSLRYLKEHESRKQKGNARFNALKGYLPLEGKLGNSIIVASGAREAELHKQGYIKQERYSAEPDTYYYTLDFTRSTFNEGIIQIIKEGDNGSDIASGFAQESYGRLVGKAAKNHKNYVSGSRINSEEALVPVWSAGGDLLGYERQISSAIRDKYLEPTYDITEAIGLMQGRLEEEKFARIKNTENIKKIISVWNNAPFGQRRSFINLEERLAKDPVLNEAWELIPIEYRVMLKNGFGKDNPIMVPASLVEDIIGIRSASISDIYTGVSRWSPTTQAYVRKFFQLFFGHDEGKAYRVLTKLENTLKHIMSSLRTTIVVRSLVVPFNNIISNAFDLMICGVSPVVLAKETPKILIQIEKYQQIMRQLVHIDTLLRSQQPNKVELEMKKKALTEALDSLTDIMPLIKAGEFSTVADLNTDDTGKYSMGSDYLGFLDELAKKTPKELKNVIRYGVISEDTSLYRILHKSVVYGDFVAKCLLYKHLEKQGKDHKEILALVKEHFVDYDRIAGRTRDYLERIGLLWFYNYKLRILKTALWLIRHNPLYSLMSIALPIDALIGDFDTPLTENIITKVSDLFHTIGTEMIARAPFMNPWLQIAALLK